MCNAFYCVHFSVVHVLVLTDLLIIFLLVCACFYVCVLLLFFLSGVSLLEHHIIHTFKAA